MSYFDDIYHIESSLNCFIRLHHIDESDFNLFVYELWKKFMEVSNKFHFDNEFDVFKNVEDTICYNILCWQCRIDDHPEELFEPKEIIHLLKGDPIMMEFCKKIIANESMLKKPPYRIDNYQFLKDALAMVNASTEPISQHST